MLHNEARKLILEGCVHFLFAKDAVWCTTPMVTTGPRWLSRPRPAQAFVQQLLQDTTPALDVLRANFK